jgi:glycosyltransferase involved in cell wall biosynthesis
MHVVIVDGDISYPATSGKRLRTLNLMLPLARRHRLTYVARNHDGPDAARRAAEFLRDHGIEPLFVDHPLPTKKGPRFYLRLAANLLSPVPYSVATHTSAAVRQAVRAYAEQHRVDVWQFEWPSYMESVHGFAGARKVLIAHNVDTLIWQRYFETERNPLKRWYIKGQWRKFERFERRAFAEADCVVAVSEPDAAIVRDTFGVPQVEVVDNGIDRAFFENVRPCREANRVLFLGALDWRPNLDGLGVMLDQVFPELRQRNPSVRLDVVGRNPPEALRGRLQETPGVELHADVADVRPFLARAGVMAVPLRVGGGSRLKILEALATGLPVVSTRVGAEGLCLRDGEELTLAEPAEMALALAECIRHPDAATAQAERGRQVVLERYDWNVLADRLEQVWDRVARKEATCAPC